MVAPCYVGRSRTLPQKTTMVAENCAEQTVAS